MKIILKYLILISLLIATWLANNAHLGVYIPSKINTDYSLRINQFGHWYPRKEFGINQIVLWGSPFERGLTFGHFTQELLKTQEDQLVKQFTKFFPSRLKQYLFINLGKRWFWGMDKYLDPEWLEEMHGVSLSAPAEYNYLSDPYSRQLGYHALHEVGQMFVDYGGDSFGCTVLAVPNKANSNKVQAHKSQSNESHWIIGRNFDFEGGRVFDEEKILKWVFPDQGLPFVSVIWAGMVGAVTGVNANGVYISINAAGSMDFSRLGTPSTLIILKALQYAKTAEEAVEIFEKSKTIITEIFVVTAPNAPLYVIEKSPSRTFVTAHTKAHAVANHLTHPEWANDKINEFRKNELTSMPRLLRANQILDQLKQSPSNEDILNGIRDKYINGALIQTLGNRRAIDALIATHAIIYNTETETLYVSKGPSLVGEFLGFNLKKTFASRKPIPTKSLSADPALNEKQYHTIKNDLAYYTSVLDMKQPLDCDQKTVELYTQLNSELFKRTDHYLKYMALGRIAKNCSETSGNLKSIESLLRESLERKPAYRREELFIQNLLNN